MPDPISTYPNKVDKRHGILVGKIIFIFNVFSDSINNLIIWCPSTPKEYQYSTGHHGNNESCKKKQVTALEYFINRFRFHIFRRDSSSQNDISAFLHQYEYRKILLIYALVCMYCIINTDNFYIFIYYALNETYSIGKLYLTI